MTDAAIVDIIIHTMFVTAKVVGPMLLVSLVVGFTVSLLQSVTQIQEFTLTFVPKFIGLGLVLLLGGPWMLAELIGYTNALFDTIPALIS
jgi:flagellar biosynthesis protein FliQ